MYNYELVVILDATRPEEEIRAGLARVREILDSFKCEVTYVEEWGRRKMAFAVKKKIEGFYVVFYFRVENENYPAAELERFARISDIVVRHMLVRVPKLKTEDDARREQAQREAEQAMREEQRAKAMAAEAARIEQASTAAAAAVPAEEAAVEEPVVAEEPVVEAPEAAAEEAATEAQPDQQ